MPAATGGVRTEPVRGRIRLSWQGFCHFVDMGCMKLSPAQLVVQLSVGDVFGPEYVAWNPKLVLAFGATEPL